MAAPKGQPKPFGSGRKKGTPNKAPSDLRLAFRKHGPELVQALLALAQSTDENVRFKAVQACLDRGWGRPQQVIEPLDDGVQIVAIERIIVAPQQLDAPMRTINGDAKQLDQPVTLLSPQDAKPHSLDS